jgi:hypothetical protein
MLPGCVTGQLAKQYNRSLYLIGLIVYVGYAVFLFFTNYGVLSWITEHNSESLVQSMKAEKPWIEASREFGGLLIVVVVLLINMYWLTRANRAKPTYS